MKTFLVYFLIADIKPMLRARLIAFASFLWCLAQVLVCCGSIIFPCEETKRFSNEGSLKSTSFKFCEQK